MILFMLELLYLLARFFNQAGCILGGFGGPHGQIPNLVRQFAMHPHENLINIIAFKEVGSKFNRSSLSLHVYF